MAEGKKKKGKSGPGYLRPLLMSLLIIAAAVVIKYAREGLPFDVGALLRKIGLTKEKSAKQPSPVFETEAITSLSVLLKWKCPSTGQGMRRIERRRADSDTYELVDTAAALETTYQDAGLTEGTRYCYRITSCGDRKTLQSCVTTMPATPEGMRVVLLSNSSVKLYWKDMSGSEEGYRLERKKNVSGNYVQVAELGPDTESYSDSGLEKGAVYCYRVAAYKYWDLISDYSTEICTRMELSVPAPPSGLTATAMKNGVYLSWTDNSNNETGFLLERKIGRNGKYEEVAEPGQNITGYENKLIGYSGMDLYYRIRSFNMAGASRYSDELRVKVSFDPHVVPPEKNRQRPDVAPPPGSTGAGEDDLPCWRRVEICKRKCGARKLSGAAYKDCFAECSLGCRRDRN